MNTRHRIAILIGVAFALGAAGCADGDTQTQAAADSQTEQAASENPSDIVTTEPSGPYIGTWHATLTTEEASDKGDGRLAGPFGLTLNEDGTYTMSQSLDGESKGHYAAASGNRLVLSQDSGCDMNFKGVGVYRWKVEDEKLTITNVVPETGGCTGRTDTVTFPVWQRR